jgi:hypothetical protein
MDHNALEYHHVVHEAHHQLMSGIHVEELRWALDALKEANAAHALVPLLEAKIAQLVLEAPDRVPVPDRRRPTLVPSKCPGWTLGSNESGVSRT